MLTVVPRSASRPSLSFLIECLGWPLFCLTIYKCKLMEKIAFNLRVGDIIKEGRERLTITEIKGVHHPAIGLMVRLKFKRGGYIPKGYATLSRKFNVVGHV